ncbi:GntR family transcriptional regulator [Pseudomonas sp. CC120222-01a]|uniref:GntR family transcriptional regulator n=1 Tax=Pseudomonas sp. CC120222-01a TaxID=1378075 RepID=UPI000D8EC66A|nr:GntR family transcriptional regulator [Pseudomonas sp. CC120222-01a]PVZ42561.1 DNA-binding GntR family transcriptional regulator [Pseudomonas sp. CC120222-01a]
MVSEQQLSAELNMGRTPIREALQRLRQIGFVEMQPRCGTLVCGTDIHQQLELLEVRRPLEELMVKCASQRATDEERAVLRELASQILKAAEDGDTATYLKVNRQIHIKEVDAAHNSMLTAMMTASHAQSRRFWYQHIQQNKAYEEGARCHAKTLIAIADNQPEAAVAAACELMMFLERLTCSRFTMFSPQVELSR